LMQMIDGPIEGFETLHHQISAALDLVKSVGPLRQLSRISDEVAHPGGSQGIDRNIDELPQRTKKRFSFVGRFPGIDLAAVRERKQIETKVGMRGNSFIKLILDLRPLRQLGLSLDIEFLNSFHSDFCDNAASADATDGGFEKIVGRLEFVNSTLAVDQL